MVKTLFLQQKESEGKTKDMRTLAVLWMLFSLSLPILASAFHFDFYPNYEIGSATQAIKNWFDSSETHNHLLTSPDLLVSILTTAGTLLR